ncbi:MAG: ribosomal L7Ae/L30e/S12e/Gadd45 family protein [Solirubrobacterales bacterium]
MNSFFQFLGIAKKAGKIVEGYNKCEEAAVKNKLYLIIISKEVSENTKGKFKNYSLKYKIPLISDCSKDDMGSILGMSEINLIGISDKKIADQLMKLWQENE